MENEVVRQKVIEASSTEWGLLEGVTETELDASADTVGRGWLKTWVFGDYLVRQRPGPRGFSQYRVGRKPQPSEIVEILDSGEADEIGA